MELTKVLLVEDDDSFALLVDRMLGNGYEVIRQKTLEAGLQAVAQNGVDVVLLDLTLPDSEAELTLRRFFETRLEVAVLILSNHSDPGLMMKALAVGAQGYLVKGKINAPWIRSAVFQAVLGRQYQRRHRDQLVRIFQELYQVWEEESVRLYQMAKAVTEPDEAELIYASAEVISDRLARLAKLIAPEIARNNR